MTPNSHKYRAANLLRDAAKFFLKSLEQDPALEGQMTENAEIFQSVADLVEKDPRAKINDKQVSELASRLLKDAAKFFRMLADQNKPLREQMQKNASVYDQIATLIASEPDGVLEERSPSGDPAMRDPLSPVERRTNAHATRVDPVFGLSIPCPGQPRPQTIFDSSPGDKALARSAAERDRYGCRYCGFRSNKYHSAVSSFGAFTVSQVHTACIFCAQVTALDRIAEMRSGVLVWLPELGQAELNAWMRPIYLCRIAPDRGAEARDILDALMSRRAVAKTRFGSDDPQILARRLAEAPSPEAYARILTDHAGLRLLPLDRRIIREADLEFNQFPQILAYWRSKSGPFGGMPAREMNFSRLKAVVDVIRVAA